MIKIITIKYKNIYDKFIEKYEEIHLNPWHEITHDELNTLYEDLINKMDINDDVSFFYFMNYLLKRLSGKLDSHTTFKIYDSIPLKFRIIDNRVFVSKPEEYKKLELLSINGVDVHQVLKEMDEVLTYGTEGGRLTFEESGLSNRCKLLGLPSLNHVQEFNYEFVDQNGIIRNILFPSSGKIETTTSNVDNNCTFEIVDDNTIIYIYNSCTNEYTDKVIESVQELEKIDFTNINKFIVDLRDNMGGNSENMKPLIEFLKNNPKLQIIALTNYKIYSSGRFSIKDLVDIGAITIGEEIAIPTNNYGNNHREEIDGLRFNISSRYFNFKEKLFLKTKEEYQKYVTPEMEQDLDIFKPDIEVVQTVEDFINDRDPILDCALSYGMENSIKM